MAERSADLEFRPWVRWWTYVLGGAVLGLLVQQVALDVLAATEFDDLHEGAMAVGDLHLEALRGESSALVALIIWSLAGLLIGACGGIVAYGIAHWALSAGWGRIATSLASGLGGIVFPLTVALPILMLGEGPWFPLLAPILVAAVLGVIATAGLLVPRRRP